MLRLLETSDLLHSGASWASVIRTAEQQRRASAQGFTSPLLNLSTLAHCPMEIVSHPGFVDEGLTTLSDYVDGREEEARLLSDPEFKDMLDDLGRVLSNFGDL